jgi:septal ring factor EnvC (AmiA/AmiB activator)
MRKPFDGEFPQTQGFNDPCCQASYAQFGMIGHNGLDFGCPTGTRILAPHDGKVIEATLDPTGYGIYLKIENTIEGSVLAHLREYRVGVGDGVKEGDLIAYSNNSGNSTGSHLHWGYYRFPRDRQNGFAGFIDQTPYIGMGPNLDLQAQLNQAISDRDRNWNFFQAVCEALKVGINVDTAVAEATKLITIEQVVLDKDRQLAEVQKQAQDLQGQLTLKDKAIEDVHQQAVTLTVEIGKLQQQVDTLTKQSKDEQDQLIAIKEAAKIKQRVTGFKLWLANIILK